MLRLKTLAVMVLAVVVLPVPACRADEAPPAQAPAAASQPSAKSIGLAKYRLVRGPVRVAGVSDNLSGVAWVPTTNTLLAVLNGPSLALEMTTEGKVLRVLSIVPGGDTEGIAWMGEGKLAIAYENEGRIGVFDLPPREGGAKSLRRQDAILVVGRPAGNQGLEGVACDIAGRRLFGVKEKSPALAYEVRLWEKASPKHPVERRVLWQFGPKTIDIDDAAGCHYDAATGHLLVVSDESACLVECTLDGKPVGRLKLNAPQAEGVSMDARRTIYVVSEPNLLYVYARPDAPAATQPAARPAARPAGEE